MKTIRRLKKTKRVKRKAPNPLTKAQNALKRALAINETLRDVISEWEIKKEQHDDEIERIRLRARSDIENAQQAEVSGVVVNALLNVKLRYFEEAQKEFLAARMLSGAISCWEKLCVAREEIKTLEPDHGGRVAP